MTDQPAPEPPRCGGTRRIRKSAPYIDGHAYTVWGEDCPGCVDCRPEEGEEEEPHGR